MTQHLELEDLLALTAEVPGDPSPDDLGILVAAVARHRTTLMETEVYGSLTLKAAALLQTLARLPALTEGSLLYAWIVTKAFLDLNDVQLRATPDEQLALAVAAERGEVGVRAISGRLATWTTQ